MTERITAEEAAALRAHPPAPGTRVTRAVVDEALRQARATEPVDTCRPVEVDGETIRVRGAGELTPEGQAALAEVVRAGKRRFAEEALTGEGSTLREHIAQALFDADKHDGAYRTAGPDIKDYYRKRADAVLEVVLPHGKFLGGQLRDVEGDVQRVVALYERWVKAGPPPLGTSMSRWWDARLVELHDAILPPTDQTTEK